MHITWNFWMLAWTISLAKLEQQPCCCAHLTCNIWSSRPLGLGNSVELDAYHVDRALTIFKTREPRVDPVQSIVCPALLVALGVDVSWEAETAIKLSAECVATVSSTGIEPCREPTGGGRTAGRRPARCRISGTLAHACDLQRPSSASASERV